MKCECCGEREASVFISRNQKGEGTVLALCDICAGKRGLSAGKDKIEINIEDLLLNPDDNSRTAKPARCPSCGALLDDLRKNGRLGCPACADALHAELERHFRARAEAPFFRDHPFNVPRWAKDPKYRAEYGKKPPVPRSNEPQDGVGAVVAALENAAVQNDGSGADKAASSLKKEGKNGGGKGKKNAAKTSALSQNRDSRHARAAMAEKRRASPANGLFLSLDTNIADGIVESSILSDICGFVKKTAAQKDPQEECRAKTEAGENSSVVLWTEARISRNFDGVPFGQVFAPDVDGLVSAPLSEVSDPVKRALIESSRVSREYALMPRARIGIDSDPRRCFLLGKEDHLCVLARVRGLDIPLSLELAQKGIEDKNWTREFAFDPDFGYLSSRVENCGTGLTVSAELHLPALEASGLMERALKSLMAAGYSVRGFYGSENGSAGDLYEVTTAWSYGAGAADIAAAFGSAVSRLAASEIRTRQELAAKEPEALLDRAGRALGVLQNCRFIDSLEAVDLLSTLRLASLCGLLSGGPDPYQMGLLMHSLGPAALALASEKEESGNKASAVPDSGKMAGNIKAGSIRAEDMKRAVWLSGLLSKASLVRPGTKKE